MNTPAKWPELSIADWKDTCATVHRWTQIIGKIRTAQMPWINHSWHVTLYVTPRGLTTLAMPHGNRSLQIDFDFIDHRLLLSSSDGTLRTIELAPMSVADFYSQVMKCVNEMTLPVKIHGKPNEVDPSVPFAEDTNHKSYDADGIRRFHEALVQTDRVMQRFRAGFRGKCSPVHFFWGSFDLAVTRFSEERHQGTPVDFQTCQIGLRREAYSHEVSSCGFWPGGGDQEAIFYSYSYPEPDGFSDMPASPRAAGYSKEMGEFVLPYEAIQRSDSPDEDLLAFFQSTYEAAAEKATWDRTALEWVGPQGP